MPYTHLSKKLFNPLLCMGFVLFITACQPVQPSPASAPQSPLSPLSTPESVVDSQESVAEEDVAEESVTEEDVAEEDTAVTEVNKPTDDDSAPASTTAAPEPAENAPVSAELSRRPRLINIPAIGLRTIIKPMGWTIAEVRGERITKWVVPATGVGWHINSATVGDQGNMVLSGHQSVGDAILAPIALGEAEVGQEILITDEEGMVFAYKIVEVSEPVPIIGASEEEKVLALSYVAQSEADITTLTIITGWPDFTTTHRIFVVAEFVGTVDS